MDIDTHIDVQIYFDHRESQVQHLHIYSLKTLTGLNYKATLKVFEIDGVLCARCAHFCHRVQLFFSCFGQSAPSMHPFFSGHLNIYTLEGVVAHSQPYNSLNCSHD